MRRPAVILYAARTDVIWHDIFSAARFYILISLILVGATSVILIVLLRRLLQPLRELAVAASTIDAGSLSFNPPRSALRLRESKPLADALSAVVTRLRRAFEMEQQFVGDASHELKTAVAVVRSSLQLMRLRPRSVEEYGAGIDRALGDNRRVEELVSSMLTLARFTERPAAEWATVDLGERVETAIGELSSFAEVHTVSLAVSVEALVAVRMTAEGALVLISNVVINAVQHSPEGAVVEVTVRRDVTGTLGVLEVTDSGPGIAPDKLPHVFERFYRADSSRSRQTGGAGLGLAICKSIAEAFDGTLAMESEEGRGTLVRATFRLA